MGVYQKEADRLAVLLDWQPTGTVAEIGAGHGQLTLAAAKRLGKIYSTELDDKLVTNLQQLDDEPPANSKPPDGVPQDRGGHGMPQKLLVEELTSAGFQGVQTLNDWPNHGYCAVFRKPRL
jgi:hypothetical protein